MIFPLEKDEKECIQCIISELRKEENHDLFEVDHKNEKYRLYYSEVEQKIKIWRFRPLFPELVASIDPQKNLIIIEKSYKDEFKIKREDVKEIIMEVCLRILAI